MPILDPVKNLCAKLHANLRWRSLFAKHGLDLGAVNLAAELHRPLTVDRTLVGFEDFADDGVRAIEPGSPSLKSSKSFTRYAVREPSNAYTQPRPTP